MSRSRTNLIAGVGALYTAATGEALPELDDIDTGIVTPAGNWSQTPYFTDEEGVTVVYTPELEPIKVADYNGVIKHILVGEEAKVTSVLAETDMPSFQLAISAITNETTAAAADQTGQDHWGIGGGSIAEKALLWVGTSPEGYSRVIHVPLCVSVVEVTHENKKKKGSGGVALEFNVMQDTTATTGYQMVEWYDMTAVPTS